MFKNPPTNAGDWFDPRSGKIPLPAGQPSLHATTAESRVPQGPCCATGEANAMRSPRTATREEPPLAAPGESPRTAAKTRRAVKIKKFMSEGEKSINLAPGSAFLGVNLPLPPDVVSSRPLPRPQASQSFRSKHLFLTSSVLNTLRLHRVDSPVVPRPRVGSRLARLLALGMAGESP